MACRLKLAHCLVLYLECYWNAAKFTRLHIFFGYFCATTAELSSCDEIHPIYYLTLHRKVRGLLE